MNDYQEASAHGRFQPLHNGHMEYLLTAKERCEFLWVGIAYFDLGAIRTSAGPHRERPENNPLSYYERIQLITEALSDAGVTRNEFGFVPFPIESPDRIPNYLPTVIPCLTTICEEWNRIKIGRLASAGYKVVVLYEKTAKEINGHTIREGIRLGGNEWRKLVPPATIRAVESLGVAERLARLRDKG